MVYRFFSLTLVGLLHQCNIKKNKIYTNSIYISSPRYCYPFTTQANLNYLAAPLQLEPIFESYFESLSLGNFQIKSKIPIDCPLIHSIQSHHWPDKVETYTSRVSSKVLRNSVFPLWSAISQWECAPMVPSDELNSCATTKTSTRWSQRVYRALAETTLAGQ